MWNFDYCNFLIIITFFLLFRVFYKDDNLQSEALDILEGLGDLRENESLCDVRLKAEGATFQAHRVVLGCCIPLLQSHVHRGI